MRNFNFRVGSVQRLSVYVFPSSSISGVYILYWEVAEFFLFLRSVLSSKPLTLCCRLGTPWKMGTSKCGWLDTVASPVTLALSRLRWEDWELGLQSLLSSCKSLWAWRWLSIQMFHPKPDDPSLIPQYLPTWWTDRLTPPAVLWLSTCVYASPLKKMRFFLYLLI